MTRNSCWLNVSSACYPLLGVQHGVVQRAVGGEEHALGVEDHLQLRVLEEDLEAARTRSQGITDQLDIASTAYM